MKKRLTGILLSLCLLSSLIIGCGTKAENSETIALTENTNAAASTAVTVKTADTDAADLKDTWDESAATMVNLQGTAIAVDGAGAIGAGSILTIDAAGTYVLSGTLNDGQIVINATKDDEIHLVLDGVDITNLSGAPIYAPQCDKLIVTLAEGTTNSLTDGGENFAYAESADKEPNAALFCKDDLTINGTGSLQVAAGFQNGIGSKDDLLIVSGNISIKAADHGIRGNDSVTVLNGAIEITSNGDGIQTNSTEDAEKGWIIIEDGNFKIHSGHDAIQADTSLCINGGSFELTAGGGSTKTAPENAESDSYKGLKAEGDIQITAGSIVIDSLDDSIHSNGSIIINGGTLELAAGDDGIHADKDLTINSGVINVNGSYEGLEGSNVYITDGEIAVVSSDDGINAAGGSDGATTGGMFGPDRFGGNGDYSIQISGGNVTVTAGGDGLDSNGTITISGGRILSIINSTPDNEALDCDGEVAITGGTVIYGGTGTGAAPGADAAQSYVYVTGISAGKEVSVKKDGQTILSFIPEQDCQYLILTSPDIVKGGSYEVYSADTLLSTVTAGEGGSTGHGFGGGFGGGSRGGKMGEAGGERVRPDMDMPDKRGTERAQKPGI